MIDLSLCFIEKVIKVCTVQMNISNQLIILLGIHRYPCGNSGEFAAQIDLILKYLHKPKWEIVCGDWNISF